MINGIELRINEIEKNLKLQCQLCCRINVSAINRKSLPESIMGIYNYKKSSIKNEQVNN
jgi:hypothetical protein